MSTIEDKILDGPKIHYCDAENDDIRPDGEDRAEAIVSNDASSLFVRPDEETERLERLKQTRWSGTSVNTGPKGVIVDYCKENGKDSIDSEFDELMKDDSIIRELAKRRVEENIPNFGELYRLSSGDELLDAIDQEKPGVLVILYIYDRYHRSHSKLNQCLMEIAREMKGTKFVSLGSSLTNLSDNFKKNGVPALLAYRGGDLVKSIVQLEELLDKDYDVNQIRELLIDNGLNG